MRVSAYIPATSANMGPGFDCMGIALDLYNEIHATHSDVTRIDIDGYGSETLPRDDSNLVLCCMRLLYARTRQTLPPVHLQMVNRIPIASGLGSSAAALVGGLLIANAFLDFPFTRAQILRIAVEDEGHPDNVAPAFLGGAMLAYLHEDGLTSVQLPLVNNFTFAVVTPDYPLLTETARGILSPMVSRADAIFNIAHASFLTAALTTGDVPLLRRALADRLHQDARKTLVPGFDAVVQAAHVAGAIGTVLSGAGPSILAFAQGVPQAQHVGQAMVAAFAQAGCDATQHILPAASIGAYMHIRTR